MLGRGQRRPRSAQYVQGSGGRLLLNQWRVRRHGVMPALPFRHRVRPAKLRRGSLHPTRYLQFFGPVRGIDFAGMQPIRAQWKHLLRRLHLRQAMHGRQLLRECLLRSQTLGCELHLGHGLPVGILCPGRMLQQRVQRGVQGLQPARIARPVQPGRRRHPGSAGPVRGEHAGRLRDDWILQGGHLRLFCQGAQLQTSALRFPIV